MNRFIKITIFTLVCFCFNINKMYACDEDPIPVITSNATAFITFMNTAGSRTFDSNSYDPDDGEPYGSNNGIQKYSWDIFSYSSGYIGSRYGNVNSSFTFSPSALGLGPGWYEVGLNVLDDDHEDLEYNYINGYTYYIATEGDWRGIRNIYIPGIEYLRSQYGEDEHYIPYGIGETFVYSLLPGPGSNWEPDVMCLYIKDASGITAYSRYLIGSVVNDPDIPLGGSGAALEWNGLGNQGTYSGQPLPPGNYTITLYISKSGYTAYETNPLTIFDGRITGIAGTTGNVLGYDEGGTFNYDVRPDSGWSGSEPDAVSFGILDSYNDVVYWTNEYYGSMSTAINNEPNFTWNGYAGNNEAYYYPVSPGKYYLKVCVEKNGYYYYSVPYEFYIVEVDLDISGVDDYYEEGTGGFIALNDDDDNNNDTADNSENGPVTNEDNLIAITLQKVQPLELTGNVKLKATAEGSKVRIWESSTKGGSPISLSPTPPTYATPTALPKTLYVEGYDASGSVRDIELTLEFTIGDKTFNDKIKITVIDVVSIAVDASDTDSHKIASVLAAGQIPDDHFVTVQGLSGDITLIATISPDTTETKEQITWSNMTQDGTNKLKATKSRSTSGKFPATVNVGGKDARDLTDWVVWATASSSAHVINTNVQATSTGISGGYDVTHTITPTDIISQNDRPNLSGAKSTNPPDVPSGDTGVYEKGVSLAGGADKKLDSSRQIRQKVLNPDSLSFPEDAKYWTTYINYPSDSVCGNDDAGTGDENNDPYNTPYQGALFGNDNPSRYQNHSEGSVGNTFEVRIHMQAFARIEL